jgi:diaminopimelate epimerase
MSKIPFHKMAASGNDFLVIDNRKGIVKDASTFARKVCPPHESVGADGVLLLEASQKSDFLMRIINADGSEAEACGNGFRCIGLYAHAVLKFPKSMKVETLSGEVVVDIQGKIIKVKMVDPREYRSDIQLADVSQDALTLECTYINTGVPHAVIFTDALGSFPVERVGQAVRNHDRFQPQGTNVDFVEVKSNRALAVRTYERGVEAETLACGTGVTAAAIVAHLTKRVMVPVSVTTKSGDQVKVYMENSGTTVRNVFLEGGAKFVFEGSI